MKTETISMREFARRLGIGEKTIRDAVKLGKISQGVVEENGKPRILFEVAKTEVEAFRIGAKIIKPPRLSTEISPKRPEAKKEIAALIGSDVQPVSYAEAQRMWVIQKARLAELEVLEKEKTLVSRALVYSQLFDMGTVIRTIFESIPARISSDLAAFGGGRSKIEEALANEIRSSLIRVKTEIDDTEVG